MKNSLNLFMRGLEEASQKMQDEHYFQLEVAGSEEPIFRERVYCYELYHQLRLVTVDIFSYKLDGELDKHRHPKIEEMCGPKVPDFVVHKPGKMDNLVVIEVKPVTVRGHLKELKNDLEKLICFVSKVKYHRGIMLIYGDGDTDLPQEIRDEVENCNEKRILLVWHSGPGEKTVVVNRLNSHVG